MLLRSPVRFWFSIHGNTESNLGTIHASPEGPCDQHLSDSISSVCIDNGVVVVMVTVINLFADIE